jgi:hypothetical protein
MKIANAIIYSLPINKIDEVYLVGEDSGYYKAYFSEKGKNAIRVNLGARLGEKLKQCFRIVESEKIYKGNLTKKVSVQKAIKHLLNIKKNGNAYNEEILNIAISILKVESFRALKKKINDSLPFYFWIQEQINREDLIGDIAYDIIHDGHLGYWMTFKELESYIDFEKSRHWDITSFKDANKDGSAVDPSLCLKLAKLEYDVFLKKRKLAKFKFRNKEGFVYFLKPIDKSKPVKIGRARDIERRIKQLQTSLPYNLELIGSIKDYNCLKLEKRIHKENKERCIKREWYNIIHSEAIDIINNYNGVVN